MRTARPATRVEFRRRLAKIEAATTIAWAMSPLIVAAIAAVS
jgi:hypothetical protein